MQDGTNSNPDSNEAKHPPGRTPASGSDSGSAQPPGGSTANRGLGGIGTAGGAQVDKPAAGGGNRGGDGGSSGGSSGAGKTTGAGGDPNDLGQAGDYSR